MQFEWLPCILVSIKFVIFVVFEDVSGALNTGEKVSTLPSMHILWFMCKKRL